MLDHILQNIQGLELSKDVMYDPVLKIFAEKHTAVKVPEFQLCWHVTLQPPIIRHS